jgi:uncharacterized protein YjhX (UPF0386 family)
MNKYDWRRNGVEHLERGGCITNIRENLHSPEGEEVTSIEIVTEDGWNFDGSVNNRVINKAKQEGKGQGKSSYLFG